MTRTEFKDARKALGLSQNAMAEALGLKTSRAIRQYESGEREVSGPVAKLMEMLLADAALAAISALPAVTVTDDMVERAAIEFYNDPPGHGRCINDAMRAALTAALQE